MLLANIRNSERETILIPPQVLVTEEEIFRLRIAILGLLKGGVKVCTKSVAGVNSSSSRNYDICDDEYIICHYGEQYPLCITDEIGKYPITKAFIGWSNPDKNIY